MRPNLTRQKTLRPGEFTNLLKGLKLDIDKDSQEEIDTKVNSIAGNPIIKLEISSDVEKNHSKSEDEITIEANDAKQYLDTIIVSRLPPGFVSVLKTRLTRFLDYIDHIIDHCVLNKGDGKIVIAINAKDALRAFVNKLDGSAQGETIAGRIAKFFNNRVRGGGKKTRHHKRNMKRRTIKKYVGGDGGEVAGLLALLWGACFVGFVPACPLALLASIVLFIVQFGQCADVGAGAGVAAGVANLVPLGTGTGTVVSLGADRRQDNATTESAGAGAFFDPADGLDNTRVGGKRRKTRARRNRSRSHRK